MSTDSKNLQLDRGPKSVWDEPGWSNSLGQYDQQRWVATAVGAGVALAGARRGGIGGGLAAAGGLVLAARAIMGHHDIGRASRWLDQQLLDMGWRAQDRVHDASEESFPASDSPSWTPTTGASRR